MKKALPIIIGILAFCLLLGGYFALKQNNRKKAEKEAEQEMLYNYDVQDITAFSFTNAENEELVFNLIDGAWELDGAADTQISTAKIEELLNKVKALTLSNTLQNVEDLEAYGLASPAHRVTFTAAGTNVTICIGNYNGTTSSQYVYLNDDTSVVYAVNADFTGVFDVDAAALADTEESTEAQ